MNQSLYHINVLQSEVGHTDNQVLIGSLVNWKPNTTIFQIIFEILSILKTPDRAQNYFVGNKLNDIAYKKYMKDPENFI